jgi:hypothetical protein
MDTFHDVAEETSTTFERAVADFRRRGCEAIPGERQCTATDTLRSQAQAAMFDLLGDDIDGAAALMDDFEYLGILE